VVKFLVDAAQSHVTRRLWLQVSALDSRRVAQLSKSYLAKASNPKAIPPDGVHPRTSTNKKALAPLVVACGCRTLSSHAGRHPGSVR